MFCRLHWKNSSKDPPEQIKQSAMGNFHEEAVLGGRASETLTGELPRQL